LIKKAKKIPGISQISTVMDQSQDQVIWNMKDKAMDIIARTDIMELKTVK
jgi:hypothetical protein